MSDPDTRALFYLFVRMLLQDEDVEATVKSKNRRLKYKNKAVTDETTPATNYKRDRAYSEHKRLELFLRSEKYAFFYFLNQAFDSLALGEGEDEGGAEEAGAAFVEYLGGKHAVASVLQDVRTETKQQAQNLRDAGYVPGGSAGFVADDGFRRGGLILRRWFAMQTVEQERDSSRLHEIEAQVAALSAEARTALEKTIPALVDKDPKSSPDAAAGGTRAKKPNSDSVRTETAAV